MLESTTIFITYLAGIIVLSRVLYYLFLGYSIYSEEKKIKSQNK